MMLSAAIVTVMGPTIGRLPIAPPTTARHHGPAAVRSRAVRPVVRPRSQEASARFIRRRSSVCHGSGMGRDLACGILARSALGARRGAPAGRGRLGGFRLSHRRDQFSASCADSAAPSCHRPAGSSDARRQRRSVLRASSARRRARRASAGGRRSHPATTRPRLPNRASGPSATVTGLAQQMRPARDAAPRSNSRLIRIRSSWLTARRTVRVVVMGPAGAIGANEHALRDCRTRAMDK